MTNIIKRRIWCGLLMVCMTLVAIPMFVLPVSANQPDFALQSKSAILMEASTGEVIFEKASDQELAPASITKIMTMLLVMEAVDGGRANFSDKVRVSENAMRMGGSQIYLEVGEEMTLDDMLKSIAVASANDACVAVAEYLLGSEEAFVKRMNERAGELGMKHTRFVNCSGLPPSEGIKEGNISSARDIAIMSRELLKHPAILKWTSTWIDHVRNGEFTLTNTNKLVRHYQGVDGLKTGYTVEARFCLSATGVRNGLRLISVVMGAPTSEIRFKETSVLLNYGFGAFKAHEVVKKDQLIQKVRVSRGKVEEVGAVAAYDFSVPMRKGTDVQITTELIWKKKISAPLKKGEAIGEMIVKKAGTEVGRVTLVADCDVERGSIFKIILQMLRNLFGSLVKLFT